MLSAATGKAELESRHGSCNLFLRSHRRSHVTLRPELIVSNMRNIAGAQLRVTAMRLVTSATRNHPGSRDLESQFLVHGASPVHAVQIDIVGPADSGAFGTSVAVLPNGTPDQSPGLAANSA